ncbi:hypothetical protein K493DRAFT_302908 [Basidiobolus meristosporus CBS 931.73]|uniref:Uncharacterized protein n=1 Tax=Basidiobolus meristosporus CBS 931.73 TaxID=1314790 RepID=A0A1Y1Y5T9_9FUNG|nr:hypothetical protein K493DRAFT_302908 [Basidiobolus meristosporus CBS 931.73]|eukprot:ORX93076.1 hypothetical protein K493DRAFT_302908 [Basidiobolus meristosporus CBS 931.73]
MSKAPVVSENSSLLSAGETKRRSQLGFNFGFTQVLLAIFAIGILKNVVCSEWTLFSWHPLLMTLSMLLLTEADLWPVDLCILDEGTLLYKVLQASSRFRIYHYCAAMGHYVVGYSVELDAETAWIRVGVVSTNWPHLSGNSEKNEDEVTQVVTEFDLFSISIE